MTNALTFQDFNPFSSWKPYPNGLTFEDRTPYFVKDLNTGKIYLNEDTRVIRFNCLLLATATPLVHSVACLFKCALILLDATWAIRDQNKGLKHRITNCAALLFKAVLIATAPIFLELAALYGMSLSPHNGRKLYASLEKLTYDKFMLAPCFQPAPEQHYFGGAQHG